MKIGILSRSNRLYSTRRLVHAARMRGHQVTVIDTMRVLLEMGTNSSNGEIKMIQDALFPALATADSLPAVQAIIPRIGASITKYGIAVVRLFEGHDVFTTAPSGAIACSRDKAHSLQLMAQTNLPTPKTVIVSRVDGLRTAVHAVGGPPVVLKLSQGTHGQKVLLASDLQTTERAYHSLNRSGEPVLVQEFVAEAGGKDRRIIAVGNRCVAAMQRRAVDGEFRANLHLGGTAVPLTIDALTRKTGPGSDARSWAKGRWR